MNEEQIRYARNNIRTVLGETKGNLAEAARRLGCSRQVIYKWLKMKNNGESLELKKRGRVAGEIKALTNKQSEYLRNIISNHDPEDVGIQSKFWSKHSVKKLILDRYGKSVTTLTINRLLTKWNFMLSECDADRMLNWFNQKLLNPNYLKVKGEYSFLEYAMINKRRPYILGSNHNYKLREVLLYSFAPQRHYNFLIAKRYTDGWGISKDEKISTHNAVTFLQRLQRQAKNRIVVGYDRKQMRSNDEFSFYKLKYLRIEQQKLKAKGLDIGSIEVIRI